MKQAIVRASLVDVGTRLICDGGFTCMENGDVKTVKEEADGELFVDCDEGHHSLDGQFCGVGEHDVTFNHYIGFYLAGEGMHEHAEWCTMRSGGYYASPCICGLIDDDMEVARKSMKLSSWWKRLLSKCFRAKPAKAGTRRK